MENVLSGRKEHAADLKISHTVGPIDLHRLRVDTASCKIPEVPVEHDAVRFDIMRLGRVARRIDVVEPHALAVQDTGHETVQRPLPVFRRLGLRAGMKDIGWNRFDTDDLVRLLEQAVHRFRERRQQFLLRRCQIVCQRHGAAAAHQCHGGKERGRLVARQGDGRLQIAAGEPVTAFRPAFRIYRNAKRDQPVDIPVDGPEGHLEAFGEHGRRDEFAAGQQQQDAERAFDRVHEKGPWTVVSKKIISREQNEIKPDSQLSGLTCHLGVVAAERR